MPRGQRTPKEILPTPKPGPVKTVILAHQLKPMLVKYGNRVQVINSTTIIVWNNKASREAAEKRAR
jgi:hypothetical protein